MRRQIVYISTCAWKHPLGDSIVTTTALMSDGTLWRTDDTTDEWTEMKVPPGDPQLRPMVSTPPEFEAPE